MKARTIISTVTVNNFRAECVFVPGDIPGDEGIRLNLYDTRQLPPGSAPMPFLNMSRSNLADLKEAIQRAVHDGH